MAEIDARAFSCNACWKTITAPTSFRTSCGHIFCSPCAHKSFERRAQCPLCSRAVTEQDITELVHGPETDAAAAVAVFSLAAVNPAEALRIVADAVAFARAQTALYGTREVWVRSREVDKIKRELVEKENQVNSMSLELTQQAVSMSSLTHALAARSAELEEAQRKVVKYVHLHNIRRDGGGGGGAGGPGTGGGGGSGSMGASVPSSPLVHGFSAAGAGPRGGLNMLGAGAEQPWQHAASSAATGGSGMGRASPFPAHHGGSDVTTRRTSSSTSIASGHPGQTTPFPYGASAGGAAAAHPWAAAAGHGPYAGGQGESIAAPPSGRVRATTPPSGNLYVAGGGGGGGGGGGRPDTAYATGLRGGGALATHKGLLLMQQPPTPGQGAVGRSGPAGGAGPSSAGGAAAFQLTASTRPAGLGGASGAAAGGRTGGRA